MNCDKRLVKIKIYIMLHYFSNDNYPDVNLYKTKILLLYEIKKLYEDFENS